MLKYRKISNIILIIAFALIITLPQGLFIFLELDLPVDNSENRELAQKPDFKLENIASYPDEYEKYYNDNLPFRSIIRTAWTSLNFYLTRETTTDKVLVGKNDGNIASTWLFFQDETESTNPVKEAQGLEVFSEDEMQQIANSITGNTAVLKDRGVELYYAIIPNKENIYKHKLPDNITIFDEQTRLDKLMDFIEAETELQNVFYLKDALAEATKENQTYQKQDTHWNDYGAFVGFQEIVNKIDGEYNNFEHNHIIGDEKHLPQDLAKMAGIKRIFKDYEIKVEFLPEVAYTETVLETANRIVITDCPGAPIDKTLVIAGDSFRVGMIPYFSRIYSKVVYMHRCEYANYVLDTYQPDIIVFQMLERYVDALPYFNLY